MIPIVEFRECEVTANFQVTAPATGRAAKIPWSKIGSREFSDAIRSDFCWQPFG
jgi:hypothetical protein